MASEWIKRSKGLHNKREVVAMALRLKPTGSLELDKRLVAECCCEVWDWADTESRDGHVSGVTLEAVDALVPVLGFAEAMIAVGWLRVGDDGGLVFPNFDRHNGASAKVRADAALRQRRRRAKDSSGPTECHNVVTEKSQKGITKSVTREEKRREEVKNPPPACARERAFAAFGRLVGGHSPVSYDSQLARLQDSLGETVTIDGSAVESWELLDRACGDAIAKGNAPNSPGSALELLRTIADRCVRDGCWPGIFNPRDGHNGRGHKAITLEEMQAKGAV